MKKIQLQRQFKINDNLIIDDFNPQFSVDEILNHLTGNYPELTNAKIINNGIIDDKYIQYEFKTIVGTKG